MVRIGGLPTVFGRQMRRYRVKRELQMVDLAKLVGLSYECIRGYETGRNTPNVEVAFRIANALGVKLDDLMNEETAEKREG